MVEQQEDRHGGERPGGGKETVRQRRDATRAGDGVVGEVGQQRRQHLRADVEHLDVELLTLEHELRDEDECDRERRIDGRQ